MAEETETEGLRKYEDPGVTEHDRELKRKAARVRAAAQKDKSLNPKYVSPHPKRFR